MNFPMQRLQRHFWRTLGPQRLFATQIELKSSRKLEDVAATNPNLAEALELFKSNKIREAFELALSEYKHELKGINADVSLTLPRYRMMSDRPCFWFLSELVGSLGGSHPETAATLALMETNSDIATPFKPRIVAKRHGGYPVRLNNGKWTWQGPHWSRHNNRTWKSGYSSDFTYGWGK